MGESLKWDGVPARREVYQLLLAGNVDGVVFVLGPVVGKWIHWGKNRSWPCLDGDCPAGRHRLPARWSGYCPVCIQTPPMPANAMKGGWNKFVLPVSEEQANDLQAVGEPPLRLECKGRKTARGFEIKRIDKIIAHDGFPAAFDPRPSLYRVWGIRPPSTRLTEGEIEE